MSIMQKIFSLFISISIFVTIVELIRRKKLRVEYSWLWLMVGIGLFVLVIWYDFLVAITKFIGAVLPTSAIFFFGIIFLLMVNLHFSVELSSIMDKLKNLAQEIALLKNKIKMENKANSEKKVSS